MLLEWSGFEEGNGDSRYKSYSMFMLFESQVSQNSQLDVIRIYSTRISPAAATLRNSSFASGI
jgi:hypothetical protein